MPGTKSLRAAPINFLSVTSYIQSRAVGLIPVSFHQESFPIGPLEKSARLAGSPGSYGPSNSKMVIFLCFLNFCQIKSF